MSANPYLEGLFAPIDTEHTAVDLPVTGAVPPELDGRYLRNGPNPVSAVDPATYHWFVGSGMVHGLRLRDGKAEWYRNRWVRSAEVAAALGEAPPPGERHSDMDGPNTNVIGHAGRTFAIVEAGARPTEIDFELNTIANCDFGGTLPHGYSAHPKRDPDTNELHAISYWWGRPEAAEYTVVDASGRVRHRSDIAVSDGPMIHDCSLTQRFVVVYDMPVTFSMDAASEGQRLPYRWNPDHGARIGLVPVGGDGGDVKWFEVEPCYVFHPLNAYDDDDRVVLEVVRHPRMFATDFHGPNEGSPMLWRWTVDLRTGTVTETQLDDRPVEFPRVDERVVGRRHRYGVVSTLGPAGLSSDLSQGGFGLARYDLETGSRVDIDLGPGRVPGEAIFVPRHQNSAEDDGWYLSLVHDTDTDRSELVILDAQAPQEPPVARVHLPTRVPLGFHGNWIPSS